VLPIRGLPKFLKFGCWLLLVFDFHDPSSVAYAKILSIWFLLPPPCSCIMLGAKSSYAAHVADVSCVLTDPVSLLFALPTGRVPSLGLFIGNYLLGLSYLRDSWLLWSLWLMKSHSDLRTAGNGLHPLRVRSRTAR
jgi:hypothetical protein